MKIADDGRSIEFGPLRAGESVEVGIDMEKRQFVPAVRAAVRAEPPPGPEDFRRIVNALDEAARSLRTLERNYGRLQRRWYTVAGIAVFTCAMSGLGCIALVIDIALRLNEG